MCHAGACEGGHLPLDPRVRNLYEVCVEAALSSDNPCQVNLMISCTRGGATSKQKVYVQAYMQV